MAFIHFGLFVGEIMEKTGHRLLLVVELMIVMVFNGYWKEDGRDLKG